MSPEEKEQNQGLTKQTSKWFENRGLFSDHFLQARLPEWNEWEIDTELVLFRNSLNALYEAKKDFLANMNEAQTEDEFIKPVLDLLGYTNSYIVQAPTKLGKQTNRPDYALFPDEATKNKAYSKLDQNDYTQCIGIADAKYWERELDIAKSSDRDTFSNQNPSFQIAGYLTGTKQNWGILTNGRHWRLYSTKSYLPLGNYYQVDLVRLLREAPEDALKYLYIFFRKEALLRVDGRSFLDRVLEGSEEYAVELEIDIKERAYDVVELLCRGFATNFGHTQLDDATLKSIYDNSLTLLYRLLFVFYAEARELLPLSVNMSYRDSYSLRKLTHDIDDIFNKGYELSTSSHIRYQYLENLFNLINKGDPRQGVPEYNGGLFDPAEHPFLESNLITDAFLVRAIHQLARITDKKLGREIAVDYNTLRERHLGSIYEGLLEFKPQIAPHDLVIIKDKGSIKYAPASQHPGKKIAYKKDELYLVNDKGERKASGSYYTPEYIVNYIVDNTVDPLVKEAQEKTKALKPAVDKEIAKWRKLKEQKESSEPTAKYDRKITEESERLLEPYLSLKVLDPAMGSGHFLARATDFLAEAIATDPYIESLLGLTEDSELTYYRRRVVESCIYGVDLNPLAVELAKLTLWLTTMAKAKPLSFLNHHLRVGNSLIGARVADLDEIPRLKGKKGYDPSRAPVQLGLFQNVFNQKISVLLKSRALIAQLPTETLEDVHNKQQWEQEFEHNLERFRTLADVWVSTFFGNNVAWDEYNAMLEQSQITDAEWHKLIQKKNIRQTIALAGEKRFFHWELEFPEVFYDEHGGRKETAGFDAVIGNPPYYLLQRTELQTIVRQLDSDIFTGSNDVSHIFLKRACQFTRLGGMFAFIVTRYWMEAHFSAGLRRYILQNARPTILVDFENLQVWPDVNVLTVIAVFTKGQPSKEPIVFLSEAAQDKSAEFFLKRCASYKEYHEYQVSPEIFGEAAWHLRALRGSNLWNKINMQSIPLKNVCENTQGIKTGNNTAFTVSEQIVEKKHLEKDWLLPLAQAENVQRYEILLANEYVIYTDGLRDINDAPNIMSYLKPYKQELQRRAECKDGLYPWWRLQRSRDSNIIRSSKRILVPLYATHNRFCATLEQYVGMTDVYILVPTDRRYTHTFLTAVLNSKLLDSYHLAFCKIKRAGYLEYSGAALSALPIRLINFITPEQERKQLLEQAKITYQEYLGSKNPDKILTFVSERLPAAEDGTPDTEHEQSDVVHDLLAFLAEEMTRLNREKQTGIKKFLSWLEHEIIKGSIESQKYKTKIRNFHEGTLEDLLDVLKKNKVIQDPCPSAKRDTIAGEFIAAVKVLVPLKETIALTDTLIDQIVYQLYALSDEEIAIVEDAK